MSITVFGEETPGKTLHASLVLSTAFDALRSGIAERVDRGDERGATLVEYGLLLMLVFLVAFLSIQLFGETIIALFDTTSGTLDNASTNNAN